MIQELLKYFVPMTPKGMSLSSPNILGASNAWTVNTNRADRMSANQIALKVLIKSAIDEAYANEKMPEIAKRLNIKPFDMFRKQYIGVNKTFTFFDVIDTSSQALFSSNQVQVNTPDQKIFIFAGLELQESAGLVGATISSLDFGAPSQTILKGGLLKLDMNQVNKFEKQLVSSLTGNTDVIPNYFRFPQLLVLKPSEAMVLTLTLQTVGGDFWANSIMKGWILE